MNEKDFKELFHARYNSFCNYAHTIIRDQAAAEDIVQEIFVDFWKRHGGRELPFKADNYLVRAVKYKCIDFIRKQSLHRNYVNESRQALSEKEEAGPDPDREEDLILLIRLAIESLPPKTREVFVLGKINRLSYRDIALKMGISEKTVEGQMARAFKHLRISLKDHRLYQVLLFFLMAG
jgi:RNA polymerase sigma-70 factor (family 1)